MKQWNCIAQFWVEFYLFCSFTYMSNCPTLKMSYPLFTCSSGQFISDGFVYDFLAWCWVALCDHVHLATLIILHWEIGTAMEWEKIRRWFSIANKVRFCIYNFNIYHFLSLQEIMTVHKILVPLQWQNVIFFLFKQPWCHFKLLPEEANIFKTSGKCSFKDESALPSLISLNTKVIRYSDNND